MSGAETLASALAYAARGWAVFPCHSPARSSRCSCGRRDCASPAKHPRLVRGLKAASTEAAQIERWWRRWPRANVAVRTGAASGLVVIDVDPRHGGEGSLEALVAEHGDTPGAGLVATGGGGWHLYLAHPGGGVRNDAGRRLGPGLDIRGDGGYVLAPPSRHASGATYEWLWQPPELVAPPKWLAQRMVEPAPEQARQLRSPVLPPDVHDDAWATAALRGEAAAVAATVEGCRNNRLNLAAFRLGQVVGGGHLDQDRVTSALRAAATTAGLGQREAERTIASGLTAGTHRPRSPVRRSEESPSFRALEPRPIRPDVTGSRRGRRSPVIEHS